MCCPFQDCQGSSDLKWEYVDKRRYGDDSHVSGERRQFKRAVLDTFGEDHGYLNYAPDQEESESDEDYNY